ncbi:hypothetical protein AX15_001448 [Amanita polypyramis BW_CC]|nr:hypothetical protein AX15_001448 [Amanita polypyramis BW_CC]
MQQLAEQRAQLAQRRRALLRQLAALDAEIADVQARYDRLSNQTAPILRLASELLILVFDYTRARWRSTLPFALVASHVCARWRDVALHQPHFWNTIDINIRGLGHRRAVTLHRLQTYLTRSQPFPLDVFISCDTSDEALDLLLPHASRWRQLCLVTASPVTQYIQHALHRLTVPTLEYLSLRTTHGHDNALQPYSNFPSPLPQILSSTASLSFVRLAGTALWTLQPSLTNIRTLHLEGCRTMHVLPHQFRTLMATMPCLVNLSLSQLSTEPLGGSNDGHSPTLMSLKRIRICDEDKPSGIPMSLVELPVLESLSLRNVEAFNSTPLPAVQSIAFESCPLSPNELWDITQAFPTVSSLTMDQSVEALYPLLSFSSGQLKWPELKTMTVYDLIPVNVQRFCTMVQGRQQAGKPIACIRLNRRSRNVLKNKGRLQWLCEQVLVENYDTEEPWPPGLEFHDPDDA